MKLCRCGHTTERERHPDGGPCGAYNCPCEGFADVWDAKALTPGIVMSAPPEIAQHGPVRVYDGETWIGLPGTHTTRLAR